MVCMPYKIKCDMDLMFCLAFGSFSIQKPLVGTLQPMSKHGAQLEGTWCNM